MRELPLFLISTTALWLGVALLFNELAWFRRAPLVERLRPYAPAGRAARATNHKPRLLAAESLGEIMRPLARSLGESIAKAFGVHEQAALRLQRIHSPLDATAFRVRQVGWSAAGLAAGTAAATALRPPPGIVLLLLLGAPLLAFLIQEQQLASASQRWQRRLFLELPVVAEQLAMLLSAGYSLGSARNRLIERGRGCCAADLRRVAMRTRQGLSESEALREWAAVARVDAVDRLVAVLVLNGETTDLGRLLSAEARAIRKDVQRELVETMERRGQAVWIPVTVATLVPGVIFLTIPFLEALRLFSAS